MRDDRHNRMITRIEDLLDREREALLAGDLERIEDLLTEKQRLVDAFQSSSASLAEIDGLKVKAARNEALMDSTLEGIRSAAATLATFRRIGRTLETYDAKGRKRTIEGALSERTERRA